MLQRSFVQRHANGASSVRFDYAPCPGRHLLRYQGRYLMIERTREQQAVDFNTGQPWEKLQLTAVGRCRSVFENFLHEAQAQAQMRDDQLTTVYTNWGTEWRPFGPPRRRR